MCFVPIIPLHEGCPCVMIQRLLYAKEMTLKGKDGSTSIFCSLTNGVTRASLENNVSGTRTGGLKGESMTTAAVAGAEDTSSDSY